MKFKKITTGFVIQEYITLSNDTSICQSQHFVAGDPVDYEDDNGNPIEVDTEKEVYCPFEMQQPKQVGTNGVNFVCPSCKGTRLECREDGPYDSEVLNIDKDGDFNFGKINASGDADRFQCLNCGFVLIAKEKGFAEYPITEHDEVVEWCKKNCKQE